MPCKASTTPLDFMSTEGHVPRSVWDQVMRRRRRITWLAHSTPEVMGGWERRGFRWLNDIRPSLPSFLEIDLPVDELAPLIQRLNIILPVAIFLVNLHDSREMLYSLSSILVSVSIRERIQPKTIKPSPSKEKRIGTILEKTRNSFISIHDGVSLVITLLSGISLQTLILLLGLSALSYDVVSLTGKAELVAIEQFDASCLKSNRVDRDDYELVRDILMKGESESVAAWTNEGYVYIPFWHPDSMTGNYEYTIRAKTTALSARIECQVVSDISTQTPVREYDLPEHARFKVNDRDCDLAFTLPLPKYPEELFKVFLTKCLSKNLEDKGRSTTRLIAIWGGDIGYYGFLKDPLLVSCVPEYKIANGYLSASFKSAGFSPINVRGFTNSEELETEIQAPGFENILRDALAHTDLTHLPGLFSIPHVPSPYLPIPGLTPPPEVPAAIKNLLQAAPSSVMTHGGLEDIIEGLEPRSSAEFQPSYECMEMVAKRIYPESFEENQAIWEVYHKSIEEFKVKSVKIAIEKNFPSIFTRMIAFTTLPCYSHNVKSIEGSITIPAGRIRFNIPKINALICIQTLLVIYSAFIQYTLRLGSTEFSTVGSGTFTATLWLAFANILALVIYIVLTAMQELVHVFRLEFWRNLYALVTEPEEQQGFKRIRWLCVCGSYLYEDATIGHETDIEEFGKAMTFKSLEIRGSYVLESHLLHFFFYIFRKRPMPILPAYEPRPSNPPYKAHGHIQASALDQYANIAVDKPGGVPQTRPKCLLYCVNERTNRTIMLFKDIDRDTRDHDLFQHLNQIYHWYFPTWRRWLSLKSLRGINFVKFELFHQLGVDIKSKKLPDCLPPPSPQAEYSYNPDGAPIGQRPMMHYFQKYDHLREFKQNYFIPKTAQTPRAVGSGNQQNM
ncbi:hypothetical protein H072_10218 [Dactylellina haptotyla CBS 200.50]|uniref:Uncharacterized protein n=1 Tax=Dactylellina haptotyla (strain CBS 200.50) TaxID=1284197 RepID=S8BLZ6_DACHA|nr:hypothetical protein H072_10218 [Dactylellina haptotyla CBS 200.50]